MINLTFNAEGIAFVKRKRKIVAKVYNRPIFWKANNIQRFSFNPKYPFSLVISGMSRECETLKDVTFFIEKYC